MGLHDPYDSVHKGVENVISPVLTWYIYDKSASEVITVVTHPPKMVRLIVYEND
jgi:hypothetical protein